jgi:CRP/FNR family transcriptional regulator, cyclic AMP receptor protein
MAILLADQPFLRGLHAGDVARLADAAVAISVPAGHRFFDEGSRAENFWLLTSGRVALDVQRPGRPPLVVDTLGAGDVIGMSWLSPPFQWQFGARATEPVTGFELDGMAVIALCDSDPGFGYSLTRRMLAVASRRLQATRRRLVDALDDSQPEDDDPGQNR